MLSEATSWFCRKQLLRCEACSGGHRSNGSALYRRFLGYLHGSVARLRRPNTLRLTAMLRKGRCSGHLSQGANAYSSGEAKLRFRRLLSDHNQACRASLAASANFQVSPWWVSVER